MAQQQENENNQGRDSGESSPAQTPPQSAGETSVQAMLTLVREYIANATFFNFIVGPILIDADLALPLKDENTQLLGDLNVDVPDLDGRINALYGRVGLAIPAHLQGAISTESATNTQHASNQKQSSTIGLEQG